MVPIHRTHVTTWFFSFSARRKACSQTKLRNSTCLYSKSFKNMCCRKDQQLGRLWLWGPPGSFCESYHFIKAMLDLATAAGQPPESLADSPFFSKNTTFQSYIPSRKAHLKLGQSRKGRHFLKTKRNDFDSTTALFLLEAAVSVIGKNISVKPLWIVQASTSSPENPWTFTVMVFIVFVPKSLVLTFTYFHKIQKPLILHKTQLNQQHGHFQRFAPLDPHEKTLSHQSPGCSTNSKLRAGCQTRGGHP